jgi:hypothetical protein
VADEKITRALAARLARAGGKPVQAVAFAALDTDKLTLSSFAARSRERNQEVQTKLTRLIGAIQHWEKAQGQSVPLEVRPDSASIAITAPADLISALADEDAVVAIDLDPDQKRR